ncbi:MAG TPA: ECF-type sigma factor [Pyrinomonadaceae bacterium]|nr:ECF-type sigma factor [Pyrinomonadaceae bacterium]
MPAAQVTQLLIEWNGGDAAALDQLMPIVYEELRRIAHNYLRRERPMHTLQTSALVNEAFLRLIDQNTPWRNRAHFFAIAAQLMRRILVDYARARLNSKRGGAAQRISLTAADDLPDDTESLVALNDALLALAELDQRQSRIVELKFFGGMTTAEIAEVTGASTATVERDWRAARAWLNVELSSGN